MRYVQAETGRHRHHEQRGQQRPEAGHAREQSDADDERQMVEPQDRVTDSGKQALHERRRRRTAHRMVRQRRGRQQDTGQYRDGEPDEPILPWRVPACM